MGVFLAALEIRIQRILEIAGELVAEDQLVRRHAVQHHGARALRIAACVLLGDTGAVRHADQIDFRCANRHAHRIQILDRIGGGVETQIGIAAELIAATRGETSDCLRTVVGLFLGYRVLTAIVLAHQRMRAAGAALVEQDHAAFLERVRERARNLRIRIARRLSRTTGQHEYRIGGLVAFPRHPRQREPDLAACRMRIIFRNRKRGALRFHRFGAHLRCQRAG